MRKLELGDHRFTVVTAIDEPDQSGACHNYAVKAANGSTPGPSFAYVTFQKGPVKEVGSVNGCFIEDLLIIVIDRLEGFQSGSFPCEENEEVLKVVKEALRHLNLRTADRQKREVEGDNQP